MKCPKCKLENSESAKFCLGCGARLEQDCPQCGRASPLSAKFCAECGLRLGELAEGETAAAGTEGGRRYVTALFSDLTGYTAMAERLDPEEVKEITGRVFAGVVEIISKYEGFVEKFIGDAVVAIFGIPATHEDDPVRAIRAAREIHERVEMIGLDLEKSIGQPLSMHSGINTGLVVTGDVNVERGTHEVAGDAINLAARLQDLAKAGEILIGQETYRCTEGYFEFEKLAPTGVKGKKEPVQVYKVLSPKGMPERVHRISGFRAELIGREAEMARLGAALRHLKEGRGSILSVCGDAGTGKSRLVEEFKKCLDLEEIQWHEGHAYGYSQNFPYFPLIDLLNRAFEIKEGDSPEELRDKIKTGIMELMGQGEDIAFYIGSLYGLSHTEVDQVNPETWKIKLQQAIKRIFNSLAQRYPTVICLEDLQWADPSTLDLLRFLLSDFSYPALFICVYRSHFSLFTADQMSAWGDTYDEIKLDDLSSSEARVMMKSLLNTESVPSDLQVFVQEKVGGNPFYLEELINSLIDMETLMRDEKGWRLSGTIHDADIPSTINGVISARLDRLDKESRRLLREASVIGRAFLYEILKRVTELRNRIDLYLKGLEGLDFIRTKSFHPDLEYIFKHALIHEVIYNGVLLRERREIHEKIALVIERLFEMRLSEFYETLAFHFEQGKSIERAIHYLIKSGEKSLNRYAVQESHQYFKKAFQIMTEKKDRSRDEEERIIDLLIKWAFVFHYRGDFKGLKEMLSSHQDIAERLNDKSLLGMLYTQLGLAHYQTENIKEAYACLQSALRLGEDTRDQKVIGYACSHLSWVCPELGLTEDALTLGRRGIEISRLLQTEEFLHFNSLGGTGLAYYYRGDRKQVLRVGEDLLEFARTRANIRSLVLGHFFIGCSHIIAGDFPSAIVCLKDAIKSSADPWFSQFPRLLLGFSFLSSGRNRDAEEAVEKIFDYSLRFGTDLIKTPARILEGVLKVTGGDMGKGLRILESAQQEHLRNERRYVYATAEDVIGRIYLQMVEGVQFKFSVLKNLGFLIRNIPSAGRNAEKHFKNAIRISEQIGALGTLGNAYFNLGLLYKAKGLRNQAGECLSKAIGCFERCEAEAYLKGARETLQSIGEIASSPVVPS